MSVSRRIAQALPPTPPGRGQVDCRSARPCAGTSFTPVINGLVSGLAGLTQRSRLGYHDLVSVFFESAVNLQVRRCFSCVTSGCLSADG